MDITIWGINRGAELMEPHQEEILADLSSKFSGQTFKFGDRTQFLRDSHTQIDSKLNLMPEQEYFVPISVKCFGNYIYNSQGDIKSKIDNIMAYYKKEGQNDPSFFWDDSCLEERNYQMLTEQFMGYYEILEKTAPNVLVGYSQGGLVAKYLAWLDKNVFKKNVILGVVTVSGAVFGSPLANPVNKPNIFNGITQMLKMVADSERQIEELHSTWIEKKIIDLAYEILDDLLDGLGSHYEFIIDILKEIVKICEFMGIDDPAIDTLKVMINWLGGVDDDPNGAFYDLNILRMNDAFSVLSCSNSTDAVQTPSTSVMSCSSDVTDFLELILLRLNIHHILTTAVINIAHKEIVNNSEIAKILELKELTSKIVSAHINLEENFMETNNAGSSESITAADSAVIDPDIEKIIKDTSVKIKYLYDNQIIVEQFQTPTGNKTIDDIVKYHTDGISELGIAPLSNDFIIPSAYQIGCYEGVMDPDVHIANHIANHLTGSSVDYPAGQANYNDILKSLNYLMSSLILSKQIITNYLDVTTVI